MGEEWVRCIFMKKKLSVRGWEFWSVYVCVRCFLDPCWWWRDGGSINCVWTQIQAENSVLIIRYNVGVDESKWLFPSYTLKPFVGVYMFLTRSSLLSLFLFFHNPYLNGPGRLMRIDVIIYHIIPYKLTLGRLAPRYMAGCNHRPKTKSYIGITPE